MSKYAAILAAVGQAHQLLAQAGAALTELQNAEAAAPVQQLQAQQPAANMFGQQPVQQLQAQQPAAAANPFGAPVQQQATVTPEMIQTLIQPLVQNEQIKNALAAVMQELGVVDLPTCPAEKMPELYQRFSTVRDQAQAAGLLGGGGGQPTLV